jgi:hypothetical protein
MNIGKNMMLITSAFRNLKSFTLIPVSNDSPYVEAMYDPSSGILAVITKIKKEAFHMVPKLNQEGQPMKLKSPNNATGKTVKEERVNVETFSEFYITELDEIKTFIHMFAINSDIFDFDKHFKDVKKTKISNIITTA